MTTKNRIQLIIINIVLIVLMLIMVATISEMTAYDHAGTISSEVVKLSQT